MDKITIEEKKLNYLRGARNSIDNAIEALEKKEQVSSLYWAIESLANVELGHNAIEELKEQLEIDLNNRLLDQYKDDETIYVSEFDSNIENLKDDCLHEIVDSSVPIYNADLQLLYFMCGNDIEEAIEMSGCECDTNVDMNRRIMQGIYFLLDQHGYEYLSELLETLEHTFDKEEITKRT